MTQSSELVQSCSLWSTFTTREQVDFSGNKAPSLGSFFLPSWSFFLPMRRFSFLFFGVLPSFICSLYRSLWCKSLGISHKKRKKQNYFSLFLKRDCNINSCKLRYIYYLHTYTFHGSLYIYFNNLLFLWHPYPCHQMRLILCHSNRSI